MEATAKGLARLEFSNAPGEENDNHPHLQLCRQELDAYFAGTLKQFTVPLDWQGTDFQKSVWAELLKIPFGTSVSYMHIAKALNNTGAIRAVGAANGQNSIAIIVPCHRVIGSDGSLTGYAGGMERKRWLLQHENHPSFRYTQAELF